MTDQQSLDFRTFLRKYGLAAGPCDVLSCSASVGESSSRYRITSRRWISPTGQSSSSTTGIIAIPAERNSGRTLSKAAVDRADSTWCDTIGATTACLELQLSNSLINAAWTTSPTNRPDASTTGSDSSPVAKTRSAASRKVVSD